MTQITLVVPLEEKQNEVIVKGSVFPKAWLHGYDTEARSLTFKGIQQGYKTSVRGNRFEIIAPDGKKSSLLLKNTKMIQQF